MVADPDEVPGEVLEQRGAGRETWWRQLVVTLVGLVLYWLGESVPLPFLDREAVASFQEAADLGLGRLSILALGVAPLLTGFILVELFSLLFPPGKRLRRGGMAGRAKLNRAALIASFVIAAVQALGIALFLESVTSPGGMTLATSPGWAFRIATVATLMGATAALFALGNLLSVQGIGNGFCLFVLTDLARSAWWAWQAAPPDADPAASAFALATPVVLFGLPLLAYFVASDRERPPGPLPAFPQGILPVTLALVALGLPGYLQRFWPESAPLSPPQPWTDLVALLVLVPVLSWATFHLFSGPSRLKGEMAGDPEELAGLALTLRRRLKPSTGLLIAGAVAVFAWQVFQPGAQVSWIDFASLAIALAIGLDLRDQYRFAARHGGAERLLELDNVHLAHRLADRLRAGGVDVLLQARRYRSLFFFFGPLVKIGLLVPRDQVERAWQEIEEVPVEVV
jgi:SecY